MRILILNPPSREKHLRGNYCSNISKGVYYYPAVDLLVQSGILSSQFDIDVCDAIAEGISEKEVLAKIERQNYGGIYAVTGSSSRKADLAFFRKLKEAQPNLKLLVSGGYLLTQHQEVFSECPEIDGALLDFTSDESLSFFAGESSSHFSLVRRGEQLALSKTPREKMVQYPLPRHELFPLRSYQHPNARQHPFSLLIHSTGCPYTCDYCIYSITAYRARPVEDVVQELRHLRQIGVREAFFHDPTFAVNRDEGLALCDAISRADIGVGWFCQTRVDRMDEELLQAMKRAGCHAIMFGVETADEDLLKEHLRRVSHEKTKEIYRICRRLGIRTLSYLVIGLPGDNEETISKTVDFVKEIRSDFVSFNLAIPVIGTRFRDQVVAQGLATNDLIEFDNSSDDPAMPTRHLSREVLAKIHRKAVKDFYFRPGYLVQRLISIRSLYELKNHLREGWSLLASRPR